MRACKINVISPLRLALLGLLLVGMAVLSLRPAEADSTTYSSSKRTYKVGILLIDSSTDAGAPARGPENPDPYVFHVADSRSDVKPQGWEFVNPLAPGVVTPDIRDRWLARDPGNSYQLGQKVQKDMAAYWEVGLTKASIQELLQFDLLFIHNHRPTRFSPQDREKLRKLVDAGGVVWIEDCGNMQIDPQNPFFLEEFRFVNAPNGQPIVYEANHPILNSPYRLTAQEVAQLGDKGYSNAIGSFGTVANRVPNPEVLVNIIGVSSLTDGSGRGLPYLAAGNYGSGAIIVSAADTGCDINDFVGGVNAGSGGNSGAYSGKNFIVAHTEDLKLLYNMVAWGSATNGYRRNNRRTAASFDGVGAPLVSNFDFVNAFTLANRPGDILNSATAPLIVGNVLYVTGIDGGGQAWLRAYDLNPFNDADGDGNPDDGVPDLLLGLPYDEIYRVQIGSGAVQPSSPIYGRVQVENGRGSGQLPLANIQDRIFVATADGTIRIFPAASPTNVPALLPNGSFNPSPPALGGATGGGGVYTQPTTGPQAPAPVFFENRLYQVLPSGEVRCLSASDGTVLWRTFNPNQAPNFTMEPSGTPTLGFVRQSSQSGLAQNSGETTNDLMLYVPVRVTDQNGRISARMMTYWVGTRNEVQRSWAPGPAGQGLMNTRVNGGVGGPAAGQYHVALGRFFQLPRVRVFSATLVNGSPVSAKENYAAGIVSPDYGPANPAIPINANGQVQLVSLNGGSAPGPGVDVLISVDYDVSYVDEDPDTALGVPANYASNPTQVGARPNSILTLPQYFGSGLTTPALSPEDGLFFSVVQQFDGGTQPPPPLPSIYSINEQEGDASGSTSKLRWRFSLFNDFTQSTAPADVLVTRQVDNVAVTDTVPIVNYVLFDPTWPRSPAIVKGNTPEALRNLEPVGSPITTNEGVTYVLARGASQVNNRPMSVLMAFKSNPALSLILPEPFEETAGVTISQTDFNSDPANPGTVTTSSNQTIGPNMTLDGTQGRINILNFRAGARAFSASQSFVVRYTPRGTRQERRVVIPPVPLAVADPRQLPVDATGKVTLNPGGFTPLLWYYVLPGNPAANTSPTLAGDFIYWVSFVDGRWHTIGVDADAAAKDPEVRPGFGQQVLNVGTVGTSQVNHVRMAQPIGPPALTLNANIAPPVIAQGQLVVNTSAGSFAYQPGVTLVADSKRLIEAGADGAAIWSLEAALSRKVGGGEEPVYAPNGTILNPPATGTPSVVRTALARPNTARKIGASDYLIADTGNNRALRVDRAGRILWTLSKVTDPYGILASGESKTLREPTDVQFYTTPTLNNAGTPVGYEIHYLVADAGNNRIIEVADYYNTEGRRIAPPPPYAAGMNATDDDHAVVWVSRTAADGGRQLRFQNIQRFLDVAPASSPFAGLVGYPYISAIVSNSAVGSSGSLNTADFTGGSLVVMSYSPYRTAVPLRNPTSGAMVGTPQLWPIGAPNARATEPAGNGNVMFSAEDLRIITNNGGNTVTKRINAPTFFQQLNLPTVGGGPQRTLYLICDAEGAYVVEARVVAGQVVRDVLWMFTQQDYNVMNGIVGGVLQNNARLSVPNVAVGGTLSGSLLEALPKFQPTSIQLLPNGNYLITNAYTGRSALFDSGQFAGEVFEVDPAGFSVLVNVPYGDTRRGGTWASFSVPRLETGSFINNGNGLNKQIMGNPVSNTGLVEQPLSASRP